MSVVHSTALLIALVVALFAAAPTTALAACTGGTHYDQATITIRK
jgi:hypothetical protein